MLPSPESRAGAVLRLMGTNAGCWVVPPVFHHQDFKKRRPSVCWSSYCWYLVYSYFPTLLIKGLK